MRLTVHDAGKDPLFDGISFTLEDHEGPSILTVMGPSGTGKTTLLKCIAGLDKWDRGRVTLEDKTPEEYGIAEWRSRVTYVPQRPPLLKGTPADFYKEMITFRSQRPKAALHDDPVEIGVRWNVPHELWSKPWSQLSGGEAQRIMLAIAVASAPDVLLLDEPTSALDAESTRLVEDTLQHCNCIWITHSMEQDKRIGTQSLVMDRTRAGSQLDQITIDPED